MSARVSAGKGLAGAARRWLVCGLCVLAAWPGAGRAERVVTFPPAESKPPPPAKAPPRTIASGEDTSILIDFGPAQRKTQERVPPPPTTLTVMYKIEYGEMLKYVYPDGTVQTFKQWMSYQNDGYNLLSAVNQRLADGNNYQYATKPLASSGFDPVDIPLLYMTGDYDFVFKESEVEHLRRFLVGGGTIIFNAARGIDDYTLAVSREMRKVFPKKSFMKMPLDHPAFNTRYRIAQVMVMINGVQFLQPPELYAMDIGTRAAAILIPSGMGAAWSSTEYHPAGKHIVGESAIRLGVNLCAYVLGGTEYGRFLAQEFPVYDSSTRPGDVLRFALARYAGSWDVNPVLQNSMLQGLKENTGIDVDYAPHTVDLDSPELMNYPLVVMTGHYDFELTAAEIENVRTFLNKGGMLLASAAAGLKPFDTAFRRELKKAFPDNDLIKLPPTHPIFSGGWNPIDTIAYTPPALRDDPTLDRPEYYGLFLDNRPAVIYTPFDLFSGVNRESNAYAKGVTSDDALRLAINLMTFALSH
jgi:hypothetical protein